MKKRDYYDYIQDVLTSIDEVDEFTKDMSFDEFAGDKKTINAVVRSLEVLGEAAKKIPADMRKKNVKVPWNLMAGMRDKLIHQYFSVDLEIVWKVVKEELPPIRPFIEKIITELIKEEKNSL
ncbi:hypothetical protein BMS3Abin16_00928 [archaeon BMS3Abin16]|nr:hypothetical protein BMS3Abin16_00928 [archaeon BMS3Abin16]